MDIKIPTKAFNWEASDRVKKLPPYLFAEIDRQKRELIKQGKQVIDLGVGDPDIPTPGFIIDALSEAARDPSNHRYALDAGMPIFRESVANWFARRFNVKVDTAKEILPLIGSKEGIAHLPLAVVNPGDVVLVPDPGYPVYKSSTWFAGGEVVLMPLLEQNHFLPDFDAIPQDKLAKAKLMFLNYPNNPTSALGTLDFFKKAVEFARQHKIIIAHDAAYSEFAYDGVKAPSILEVEGAGDVAIELHSLSKTFNMTGWRVGFAVGNPQVIALLGKIKSNIDSGIFQAVQLAAKAALDNGHAAWQQNLLTYQSRRDMLVDGFNKMGWPLEKPKSTFYCWIPVPPGYTSAELVMHFLNEMNIVVTPGNGFGPNGEGYFRISLTVPETRIQEALSRIAASHKHLHKA